MCQSECSKEVDHVARLDYFIDPKGLLSHLRHVQSVNAYFVCFSRDNIHTPGRAIKGVKYREQSQEIVGDRKIL